MGKTAYCPNLKVSKEQMLKTKMEILSLEQKFIQKLSSDDNITNNKRKQTMLKQKQSSLGHLLKHNKSSLLLHNQKDQKKNTSSQFAQPSNPLHQISSISSSTLSSLKDDEDEDEERKKKWKCVYCPNKPYASRSGLDYHHKTKHPNKPPLTKKNVCVVVDKYAYLTAKWSSEQVDLETKKLTKKMKKMTKNRLINSSENSLNKTKNRLINSSENSLENSLNKTKNRLIINSSENSLNNKKVIINGWLIVNSSNNKKMVTNNKKRKRAVVNHPFIIREGDNKCSPFMLEKHLARGVHCMSCDGYGQRQNMLHTCVRTNDEITEYRRLKNLHKYSNNSKSNSSVLNSSVLNSSSYPY